MVSSFWLVKTFQVSAWKTHILGTPRFQAKWTLLTGIISLNYQPLPLPMSNCYSLLPLRELRSREVKSFFEGSRTTDTSYQWRSGNSNPDSRADSHSSPRFRYWNKHISCWNRPFSPKLGLELGYFNACGCRERKTIISMPFFGDTKPYCRLNLRNASQWAWRKDFLSHHRKLINDLQNSAKTTHLYCTVL